MNASAAGSLRRSARLTVGTDALRSASAAPDAPGPHPKRAKRGEAEGAGAAAAKAHAGGLSRRYEEALWAKGFAAVAGVDEAGRGPLAGPVVAAACVIPAHVHIDGIDDSKKLSAEQREKLYVAITTHPEIIWAAEAVDVATIDTINILQATLRAMELSVAALRGGIGAEAAILVDGNRLPSQFDPARSSTLIKGDSKSFVIAAASVLAKVTRDRMMDELHLEFPLYNFAQHRGYGVPEHVAALRKHGPCPHHRRTFAPVKTWWPLPAKPKEEAATA